MYCSNKYFERKYSEFNVGMQFQYLQQDKEEKQINQNNNDEHQDIHLQNSIYFHIKKYVHYNWRDSFVKIKTIRYSLT